MCSLATRYLLYVEGHHPKLLVYNIFYGDVTPLGPYRDDKILIYIRSSMDISPHRGPMSDIGIPLHDNLVKKYMSSTCMVKM